MRDVIRHRLVPLGALMGVLAAQSVWWIGRHRPVGAVDRDEGFLLSWALVVRDAWGDGLRRPPTVWIQHEISAPLVGAVTGTWAVLAGDSLTALLAVQVLSGAAIAAGGWAVARSLGASPGAAWLGAAVLATSPLVVWFTRVHHQIAPAAAIWVVAVALGLRTDGLRSRRLSLALGAAVGSALLTRAMLAPLAPLIIVAVGAGGSGRGGAWRPRLLNGALASGLAGAIALTWWAPQGATTVAYLRDGATDPSGPPPTDLSAWSGELARAVRAVAPEVVPGDAIGTGWRWPAALALAIAGLTAIGAELARRRGRPRSELAVVVSLTLATLVVLGMVREDFPGFSLLVVVLAVPAAAAALSTVSWPPVGRRVVGALALVLVLHGALSGLSATAGWTPRHFGRDGRPASSAELTQISATFTQVVAAIAAGAEPGERRSAAVLTNDFRVDTTTFQHLSLLSGAPIDWVGPYQGAPALESAAALREWIDSQPDDLALVTTAPTTPAPDGPVTESEMAEVAAQSGFEIEARLPLPRGRAVLVWTR